LPGDIGNFFDDDDYVLAYNDALDELGDATEVHEIYVTVKRRKWAVYADLRSVLPTTVLRVTAVWNPLSGKWLDPTTPRELDLNVGRGWEKIVDSSRWWFMRGLWTLGAFPVPGDDTSPLRVHCSALLDHVELDGGLATGLTLSPPIPRDFDMAIQEYMLSSLLSDRGESKKAIEHWASYKDGEQSLGDASTKRMSRDRVPRMGARR